MHFKSPLSQRHIGKQLLLLMTLPLLLLADPFSILPGTKAKGMAGAYSSLVEDSTAGYYNPAGYSLFFSDDIKELNYIGTTEIIDLFTYDEFSQYSLEDKFSKSKKMFIGVASGTSDYGFGISFYPVYDYILQDQLTTVENTYDHSTSLPAKLYPVIDFFHQKVDVLQLGASYNILRYQPLNTLVSVGGLLGLVFTGGEYGTNTKQGEFKQYTDKNKKKLYEVAFAKSIYSGSYMTQDAFFGFGLKTRLYENDDYGLYAGYSYKSSSKPVVQSDKEAFIAESENAKGYSILNIPSWGIPTANTMGMALSVKRELFHISLAYDKTHKAYNDVTYGVQSDIDTNAYGFEVSSPAYSLQGRIGYYNSTPDNASHISSDATTTGLSIIIDKEKYTNALIPSTADLSLEFKNYHQDSEIVPLTLLSFSFKYEVY